MRYRELDIFKGILTLQMILAHCLQFFLQLTPGSWQHTLSEYINLTTFSGFLFAFGYSAWHAYLCKPYKQAAPRIFKNTVRMLLAYYLSAFAYKILIEELPLNPGRILDILLLRSLAGWSEFLLSFAVLMLGLGALLPLMQLRPSRLPTTVAVLAIVACALPLAVSDPLVATLVGQAPFPVFAVAPYLLYFSAGLYFAQNKLGFSKKALAVSLLGTLVFALAVATGGLPSRFPLSLPWLLGGAFFLYGYYLLSQWLLQVGIATLVERVGQGSLFYLLVSNLLIFALKGSRFFRLDTGYALGSFLIIVAIGLFLQGLSGATTTKQQRQ